MFSVAQIPRVAFMATWFGKKAKRLDVPGADSFAVMHQGLEKPSAQQFGTTLDLMVNGSDRN
jgi:hypothetical protein